MTSNAPQPAVRRKPGVGSEVSGLFWLSLLSFLILRLLFCIWLKVFNICFCVTQTPCSCFSLHGFVSRFQNVSRVLFLLSCLFWIILRIVSDCPSDCSPPVDEGPLPEVLSHISDMTCMAPPTPRGLAWTLGNFRVGGVNTARGQWRHTDDGYRLYVL